MKVQVLLTNILAVAAISAIADTQPNGVTPFDNLKTTQVATFSATANGASDTKSGCTVDKADGKVTIEDGYYVVESELTDTTFPLVVNPSEQIKKTEIEGFDVTFKASFVDASDLTTAAVGGAQIGFALTSATTASYYCPGANPAWVALTKAADSSDLSVSEDADCTLHVDYDGRENKARFTIGTFKSEWVTVGTVVNNSMAVLGSGSVKSFAGETFAITAEVVIVDEREITVPEGTMEAIKDLSTQEKPVDPTTFLADTTKGEVTGLSNLERIVLTGKVAEPTIENKPKVVAKAFPTANGKLAIQLDNLAEQLPQIEGAKPKFVLEGSNDKTGWTSVAENSTGKFEFGTDEAGTKYKFYRVKASVVYPTK